MTASGKKTVGLFDIRFIIGGLVGLYGVILTLLGLFNSDDTGDGLNINLWAGLGMIVVGAAFVVWARLRPVVVPDDAAEEQRGAPERR